jgi:outer membrane protein
VGGYGNLLKQIFGRDYPNYSAGFSLNIPFRNRVAQADYVADQLQLRQSQLQYQKEVSQVRVDVKNAVIEVQQARARYETAVATRSLAQQTLEAEQNRFRFGESTIATVVQAQRDLAADQSAEVQAMANYTHAKVAFDEAVGQTLDVNGISMEEAAAGHVARESAIPPSGRDRREPAMTSKTLSVLAVLSLLATQCTCSAGISRCPAANGGAAARAAAGPILSADLHAARGTAVTRTTCTA